MEKITMTPKGHQTLMDELRRLKETDRPQVISEIAVAREHGDLRENAEYHAAREKQSFIEGRIQELDSVLSRIEVIDFTKFDGQTVRFGATVQVYEEQSEKEFNYMIVGHYEADIAKNRLSLQAPLSRALIGKAVGDVVSVAAPGGQKSYEIVSVKYSEQFQG
jgi:transcription elongation factor GreA